MERFADVDEPGVDGRRQDPGRADRRDRGRLVQERHLDGIGADRVGRRRTWYVPGAVAAFNDVDDLLGGQPGVVLDLGEADDVGVDVLQRGDDLGQLGDALGLAVGTVAVLRARRAARTLVVLAVVSMVAK